MYEVSVFPSMTKGEIVGHNVIHVLSLMSTVMISYRVGISVKMTNNVFPCVMKGQ